jgi:hypothetical protein
VFPDALTPWCLVGRRATVTYRNGEVKEGTITNYGVPDYAEKKPDLDDPRCVGAFGHHTITFDGELSTDDVYFNEEGVLSQNADSKLYEYEQPRLRIRKQGNDSHLVHSCGTVSVDFEGAVDYFKHFDDEREFESWDVGGRDRGVCVITGEHNILRIRHHSFVL